MAKRKTVRKPKVAAAPVASVAPVTVKPEVSVYVPPRDIFAERVIWLADILESMLTRFSNMIRSR